MRVGLLGAVSQLFGAVGRRLLEAAARAVCGRVTCEFRRRTLRCPLRWGLWGGGGEMGDVGGRCMVVVVVMHDDDDDDCGDDDDDDDDDNDDDNNNNNVDNDEEEAGHERRCRAQLTLHALLLLQGKHDAPDPPCPPTP